MPIEKETGGEAGGHDDGKTKKVNRGDEIPTGTYSVGIPTEYPS